MTLRAMAMQQRNQRSDLSGVGRAFRRSSMLAERAAYSESIMRMKVICLIVAFSIAFPWRIAVAAPPGTLVVVTAGQGGLMTDTGPLNPHAYRPNEFVIQNLLYEGLVSYGAGGAIEPALAESWDIVTPADGVGETAINFRLRRGVTFHDGTPWDAHACKANFDNIFPRGLMEYHGWYDLPLRTKDWQVVDDYTFRLILDQPYYPALQELALIRPVRFLSPKHLPQRPDQKSCPTNAPVFWPSNVTEFTCVGTSGVAGTGPWIFVKKVTTQRTIGPEEVSRVVNLNSGEKLLEVHLRRNPNHWDTKAGGNVQNVIIKVFPTLAEVAPAVASGAVDLVFGLDTIGPQEFKALHLQDTDNLRTYTSEPMSTRFVSLNSARPPLDSLAVRKAVAHAIHKHDIINRELAGLELPAYTLFASNVPYADVDLWPRLGYDPEKARMLLDQAGWRLEPGKSVRTKDGVELELEFLYRNTRSIEVAVEDDMRANLQALGFRVVGRGVPHDDWNVLANNGSFHLAISTTLGLPWDPHSSAGYWRNWGMDQIALSGLVAASPMPEGFLLAAPMNRSQLFDTITAVLTSTNLDQRRSMWQRILTVIHEQVIMAPLSYLVNVAVLRDRFENFEFGHQQFDMTLHTIVDRELLAANGLTTGNNNGNGGGGSSGGGLSSGALAAIIVCSSVAGLAIIFTLLLVAYERRGRPLFGQPLLQHQSMSTEFSTVHLPLPPPNK